MLLKYFQKKGTRDNSLVDISARNEIFDINLIKKLKMKFLYL